MTDKEIEDCILDIGAASLRGVSHPHYKFLSVLVELRAYRRALGPVRPPMLAMNVELKNEPASVLSGSITYINKEFRLPALVRRCRPPRRVPADVWRSLVYSEA